VIKGLELITEDPLSELREDDLRASLSKYTRKAFRLLPRLVKPRILDIGCGSGVPTIELARLSEGQIIALDIDESALDKLNKKIEEEGLGDRVKPVKCSMFEMDFPDESFDVIWAEGSISRIGFENGLREWRRLLKPKGCLVIHDAITNIKKKLEVIPSCGYDLLGYFVLREDVWWIDYYGPLEKRVQELSAKYDEDPEILRVLDKKRDEIEMVKKNPRDYSSVFFVMRIN
jgi:ubiquinone/menaquinone biosynthesis C-methylase UbiE